MAKQKIVLSEKTKMAAIGIGIVLVTLFVSYNIIYKSYKNRNRHLLISIEEEKENQILRKRIAGLYELRAGYQKFLYNTNDTDTLRNVLSSLAVKTGVDILSIQPSKPEKLGRYYKVSFNLRLLCSYDNLGRFIESIDTYPNLTKIEAITLQSGYRDKQQQEGALAEVSVMASAYCMGR